MHTSAIMSSQQSSRNHSHSSTTSSYYYYAQTTQPTWMTVIPIEDDDLTFGGKPLSDWYEEDRRRYSPETEAVMPEQEARGRTRKRTCEPAPAHHHGGHHKHHHKKSDKK